MSFPIYQQLTDARSVVRNITEGERILFVNWWVLSDWVMTPGARDENPMRSRFEERIGMRLQETSQARVSARCPKRESS